MPWWNGPTDWRNAAVPLILIDAGERFVDIPVLQFPLWLAFAAGPGETYEDDDELLR